MSTTDARLCIYLILFVALVGDGLALHFGWVSISAMVRQLDLASGGLLRWVLAGLWLHFFLPRFWGGW